MKIDRRDYGDDRRRDRRDGHRRDYDERRRDRENTRDKDRDETRTDAPKPPAKPSITQSGKPLAQLTIHCQNDFAAVTKPSSKPVASLPNLDPDSLEGALENGETMDEDIQDDEEANMMAMMGLAGFGSTKVRHGTLAWLKLWVTNPIRENRFLEIRKVQQT